MTCNCTNKCQPATVLWVLGTVFPRGLSYQPRRAARVTVLCTSAWFSWHPAHRGLTSALSPTRPSIVFTEDVPFSEHEVMVYFLVTYPFPSHPTVSAQISTISTGPLWGRHVHSVSLDNSDAGAEAALAGVGQTPDLT